MMVNDWFIVFFFIGDHLKKTGIRCDPTGEMDGTMGFHHDFFMGSMPNEYVGRLLKLGFSSSFLVPSIVEVNVMRNDGISIGVAQELDGVQGKIPI